VALTSSTCELVVVTGKGGVGKTTVAATLGAELARAGREVLVLEVDPRESVHRFYGAAPSGGQPVAAAERLWFWNLTPSDGVDRLLARRLRIPGLLQRIRESTVFQQFAAGCPGLPELCLLAAAREALDGEVRGLPAMRTVVLDAPATGHGLRLLESPRLVAEVVESGPFGRLAEEATRWLADASRSAVWAVTLAEELPVTETLELSAELGSKLGRTPALLVVNELYPPAPSLPSEVSRGSAVGRAWHLWQRRRAINERQLARLAQRWSEPWAELPLHAAAPGWALLERLGAALRGVRRSPLASEAGG
jgi:anion-transporting  ArsA/GET3 family ATPase